MMASVRGFLLDELEAKNESMVLFLDIILALNLCSSESYVRWTE